MGSTTPVVEGVGGNTLVELTKEGDMPPSLMEGASPPLPDGGSGRSCLARGKSNGASDCHGPARVDHQRLPKQEEA